ncbi:MAG: AMP-binding protein [Candidatus Margulisbacteria bacterium]|jgi:long-chain acyl-CoA synthetase|nr:AMP-binding protein [Candidatus Margulisiibacteriota bacterium]
MSSVGIPTFKQLLAQNAAKYADKLAYQIKRDGRYRQYTYSEVADLAKRLQVKLAFMGVTVGDRVALLSENRPEWPIAYLAITGLGAVVVPLDAMLKKEEIAPLLADSEPKAFILSEKFLEYGRGTKVEGREVLMEEFDRLPAGTPPDNLVTLAHLAAIVYTSGTTGTPKGVMLTHRNLISNATAGASCFALGPGDNFLSVLPLHHTFETTGGFLAPFITGCRVTYAESLKSYNLIQNMQETGVTLMLGVPLLYQLLFDGIMRNVEEQGKTKLFSALFAVSRFCRNIIGFNPGRQLFGVIHQKFGGKIRFFVSGGAAIDPDLVRSFDLMGFPLLQGYGLTESSPCLTLCTPQDNVIGSVGKPLADVSIKIAGDDAVGEILGTGPNIMKGYYKRQDLTDKVIIGGWLYTGDLGYLDESGHLFITGRSKDVIVTGSGVNVYPEELEFALKKIPALKEVCILGEKAKEGVRRGTEQVVAVIVPNDGIDEARVRAEIARFNESVAEFKRVARVIVRAEELPKTRLLKTKRFELRKELGL